MPNFTHKRKSVSRLMAPVALAVVLAGCSTPNLYNQQAPLTDITAAAAQSSAAYLSKAQASEGATYKRPTAGMVRDFQQAPPTSNIESEKSKPIKFIIEGFLCYHILCS